MNKKVLFFDIDGTLVDRYGRISEDTKIALQSVKENGNLIFLCTGRALSMIPQKVKNIGFDGIVAGGGTYVEYQGKVLYYQELTKEEIEVALDYSDRFGADCLFEGKDGIHIREMVKYRNQKTIQDFVELVEAPTFVIGEQTAIHTSKFCCLIAKENWASCMKHGDVLEKQFHIIIHREPADCEDVKANTFSARMTAGFVEYLPFGMSKAVGIEIVLKELGIPKEDTYAFGDSNNDLEMLRYVAHPVVMGNAKDEVKVTAEYVTLEIERNGISHALQHYQLI